MRTLNADNVLQGLLYGKWREKHPSIPDKFYAKRSYTGRPANVLTRKVIDYINLTPGCFAERISSTGQIRDTRKLVTDVVGRQKMIGSLQWVNPTTTRGTADIAATLFSKSCKLEVKVGRDFQSLAQKAYQQSIEQSGGIYLIVRDFQEFFDWFCAFQDEHEAKYWKNVRKS